MTRVEPTLRERAGRMYRRLLLLQRLFEPRQTEDVDSLGADDRSEDLTLRAAVREVVDELTESTRALTSIPFPISEWRSGDGPDDPRWRALTEVERRELQSLIAGYANLITWAENATRSQMELAMLVEAGGGPAQLPDRPHTPAREATEFLKAERARLLRFQQEMHFLARRPISS